MLIYLYIFSFLLLMYLVDLIRYMTPLVPLRLLIFSREKKDCLLIAKVVIGLLLDSRVSVLFGRKRWHF